jgi:N-acetylneuraminic acid mutarotase
MRFTAAVVAALAALPLLAAAAPAQGSWESKAPIPVARTEVAAAAVANGRIVVVGGYLADGATTARADEYSTGTNSWRRLPDLPVAVNHAMAATWNGRVYVLGGYSPARPLRTAFVFGRGRWQRLPSMPSPRAASGAAAVGGKLYVVGGVTEDVRGSRSLARQTLVFDLRRRRWSTIPGPTPREHLAVAAVRGSVYALAGRLAGLDTNVRTLERYTPGSRRWTRLPPIPVARGGTGAAGVGRQLISIGGEAPTGTIASVYAYDTSTRRWRRLVDLPNPRHGLGVVAVGQRVYAIAGGPRPGLTVSNANESMRIR